MPHAYSTTDLEAYLDEALPAAQMTAIEQAVRDSDQLRDQLTAINGRRDAGVHSLGEIWRRNRLSCPSRQQLGSYLLGVLSTDEADYVRFHLETVECRFCTANAEDLADQQSAAEAKQSLARREKYFHSSAGYLSQGK